MNRAILLAAALTLAASPALAQQRVDSGGRALDANQQVGSGGVNRLEGQVDYAARNNRITGNVTDFSQFRGVINYSAAGEFTDTLGSNNLFRFRADSFGSGVGNVNTSLVPPQIPGETPSVARTFAPLVPNQGIPGVGNRTNKLVPEGADYRVYGVTNAPGAGVRLNDAAFETDGSAIARFQDQQGRALEIRVSPLTGVRSLTGESQRPAPQADPQEPADASPFSRPPSLLRSFNAAPGTDAAAAPRSASQALGDRRIGGASLILGNQLQAAAPGSQRVGIDAQPLNELVAVLEASIFNQATLRQFDPGDDVYADLIRERVQGNLASSDGTTETLPGNQMLYPDGSSLSDELRASIDEPAEDRVQAAENARNMARGLFQDDLFLDEGTDTESTPSDIETDEPQADPEAVDALEQLVRRIALPTDRLDTLVGERENRFAELMKQAEGQLADNAFFAAERTYQQALIQSPGHPMARAGLIHAQMAAGMIRSASANLRGLFNDHPEVLTVRYGESVLPPADRINWIQTELQRAIAASSDQSQPGLLLAYLGYQLESRQLVRYGLAVAGAASGTDPLIPLLERLWLPEDASSGPTIGIE
ncbi:hypothetical protein [Mucisphaera sp.]|uniref:hypothetical protein n=1 Tax=Mucisphaera sp. TaxID=2913024 RepID=UPI003D0C579B